MAEAFDKAELDVLREFYGAWEELHALSPDPIKRKEKEAVAAKLVGIAHILRRMKDNTPRVLVPSFTKH
jgi:hypothetical protein